MTGKDAITENAGLFRCPVCGRGMQAFESKSLVCEGRHCFDIAGAGYINFLKKPVQSEYGKELFLSRRSICKSGFFAPVTDRLAEIIAEFRKAGQGSVSILDAGCGEGSHTAAISKRLSEKYHLDTRTAGFDISKEAVLLAAKEYRDIAWCVADMTDIPFKDGQFDFALNILSPSNYSELRRVLACGGAVVKVIPGGDYLAELRKFLYSGTDKSAYSNTQVHDHFKENFPDMRTQIIRCEAAISDEGLTHLVKMTPLAWGASEEAVGQALHAGIGRVTIDLMVLTGSKA